MDRCSFGAVSTFAEGAGSGIGRSDFAGSDFAGSDFAGSGFAGSGFAGSDFAAGSEGGFAASLEATTFRPLLSASLRAAFSAASRFRCSASVFFSASAFSAAVRCRSVRPSSGGCAGFDPTSETFGSEATFSASASPAPCPSDSASATAPGRGTRTSTRFPSARTSNSASTESSITTRAVRDPAWARAARRRVPSSISSSRCSAATSVSAKSTTTRGGDSSFMVVKESGRSPSISTTLAFASTRARTPSSRPCSSAAASANAQHATVSVLLVTHLEG